MEAPAQTLPSGAMIRPLADSVRPPTIQNITGTTIASYTHGAGTVAPPPPVTTVSSSLKTTTTRSPRKRPAPEDNEEELEVLTTRVSLVDIVSRQRITKCVKSQRCSHRQAFDFESFCKVNDIQMEFYDRIELVDSRFGFHPLGIDDVPQEKSDQFSRESSMEIIKQRFKVELKTGKVLTQTGQLKLTKKRKGSKAYRCPICNIKFFSVELIHDDFMATVMGHVAEGVESVEIDDNNVVTVLETKKPYEAGQVVISLSDDDNDDNDLEIVEESTKGGPKRKKVKIFSDDEDDPFSISDFFDTDDSGDEFFAVEGTADDPVVID